MLLFQCFITISKEKAFVQDKQQIIKYRINKAWESFDSAKLLLEAQHYYSSINRIYYACFYMVTALLFLKDLSSSKHSGVKALFNREIVNKGLIDLKWGSFYSRLFMSRQATDYEDLKYLDYEFVQYRFTQAYEFLCCLESFINENLSEP